jgi:hypothetical protein
MNFKFCEKVCKNDNSLRNHERLCKKNPNKQELISNFIGYNKKRKDLNIKGVNHYTKAKELGLPKPIMSEETRKKISESSKNRIWTEEQKRKHSDSMKKAVENHPDSYTKNNVVGRVKNVEYNGVKFKGRWEVIVAKWLDQNRIKWLHEYKSFNYEWNGIRKYYPDFYLPDFDLFLEVKGYETERDLEKWKSVSNLIVFKLNEIKKIKSDITTPLSFFVGNM